MPPIQPRPLGTSQADARRPNVGVEPSQAITISADRLQSIETRVETLTQMVRTLQAQSVTGSAAPSSATRSTTDVSFASIQEPELSSNLTGHLARQSDGVVRYADPSFWASMCQEVAELDDLLLSQARLPESADVPTSYSYNGEEEGSTEDDEESSKSKEGGTGAQRETAVRRPPGARTRPCEGSDSFLLGDIAERPLVFAAETTRTVPGRPGFLQELPSKQTCDILIESYVRGYHPMVPLVHVPTFRQRL